MDVERDAQNDQSSGSEPRVNSQPSSVGGSNDRAGGAVEIDSDVYESLSLGPKARARLKSAQEMTGFRSYVDYMSFHEKSYPSLNTTRSWLFRRPHFEFKKPKRDLVCSVTMVNLTEEGGVLNHGDQNIFEALCEALCDPSRDTSLQIILFDVEIVRTPTRRERDLFDYLGLVLQLDPRFFKGMFTLNASRSYDPRRYHPSHVTVGHTVATICHPRSRSDSLPDVIIMARKKRPFSVNRNLDLSLGFDLIRQCPSFKRDVSFEDLSKDGYILLLFDLLAENKQLKEDPTTLSLLCLLPFFRLELVGLRNSCTIVSDLLGRQHSGSEDVYSRRTDLRNSIDGLLKDWLSLETYTKSSQLWQCTNGHMYRQIKAEFNEAMANAERLESSLRDRLQLEVGKLGLEESQKSIDLSNRQIEEAKRVKIFTILAFIYVPLNLATSIFGMNIQQLNESGKSLWVFLLTALVTLAVTGFLWFLIELLNGYQNWQRRRPKHSQSKTTSSYSVGERVTMVVWLLRNHHISWMREVGAGWRIMVNDRAQYLPSFEDAPSFMSAGEYVSKYSRDKTSSLYTFSVAQTQLRMNIKPSKA